jgi:orotidine-5'-phosphate decarboxylase
MPERKLISFDWAMKKLLRSKANFDILEGFLSELLMEDVRDKFNRVDVLTSFDGEDMRAMGMTGSVRDLVLHRARKAFEIGCDGVVSSALEAEPLRNDLGENFLVVTPGIRPGANVDDGSDDQKRIATAKQAIINGADHVVIGRPIRDSKDPIALIRELHKEIAEGLAAKAGNQA